MELKINPKVRELMVEAGYATPELASRAQRLVDLVVEQCISCSNWVGAVNQHPTEPVHTAKAINKRIKKHFGVSDENL